MRSKLRKSIAACIAGAAIFGMVQMPVNAAGSVEAGVAAMLSDSLTVGAGAASLDAGVTSALGSSLVSGEAALGGKRAGNHMRLYEPWDCAG